MITRMAMRQHGVTISSSKTTKKLENLQRREWIAARHVLAWSGTAAGYKQGDCSARSGTERDCGRAHREGLQQGTCNGTSGVMSASPINATLALTMTFWFVLGQTGACQGRSEFNSALNSVTMGMCN